MYSMSIVIPTLNSASTLRSTLFSLKEQIGCACEIIVVDSGSSDETPRICELFNVPMLWAAPGNMYSAINIGLRAAKNDWVTYLNSDDLVYPMSYARLLRKGIQEHADVTYGFCDFVDKEGRFLYSYAPGYPYELLHHLVNTQLSFAQPASIFRKEFFDELGGFNEYYKLAGDLDFFLRAIVLGKRFILLPPPTVACFRVHKGQSSGNYSTMIDEIYRIQVKHRKSGFFGRLSTIHWRLRNLPNYLARIMRIYSMHGKSGRYRTLDINENYE